MIEILQQVGGIEWLAVIAGFIYVVLAARENIWCWPFAFISTAASMIMLWQVSLLMDSALNLFYLVMAVYGYWQWRYGGQDHSHREVQSWPLRYHVLILASILVATILLGYGLAQTTQAAWPYVDSATTVASVIATFMIASKVLENWLYWIVIDIVSVWIYIERGIYLYAALFVLYTIIAVYGYTQWQRNYTTTR